MRQQRTRALFACLGFLLVLPVRLGAENLAVLDLEPFSGEIQRPELFRSIDGRSNNASHPEWGETFAQLLRQSLPADYEDEIAAPPGSALPGPREISNTVVGQTTPVPNAARASGFLWQWGQFVDHDITLTSSMDPAEHFDIPVPMGDLYFDPTSTGTQAIEFLRSLHAAAPGTRQQMNEITAFIDGSCVYGSDELRALELRTLDGTGHLKTSRGGFLPFNVNGFANAPTSADPSFFLAGDIRANEQVALTAMHTLFVREHNHLANLLRLQSPHWTGDEIYLMARAIVGAEIQVITYREFLPVLLGSNALSPYSGYDGAINPGIENAFSTAAYRIGHSLLTSQIPRLQANGRTIRQGNLELRAAFFAPAEFLNCGGIEPVFRGLATLLSEEIDPFVVDDLRNFMFGQPGTGGFDLASLNIQRGRDHGLPRYNDCRRGLGLTAKNNFAEISSNPEIQLRLSIVYDSVEDIDLWIGGLAEDHHEQAMVGELFFFILKDQFERLRDGDSFWYQRYLSEDLVEWLEQQTLAQIIRRNTRIQWEIQEEVFVVPGVVATKLEPTPTLDASERVTLGQPFPNPTRSDASLLFSIPRSREDMSISAAVFDVRGRLVRTLHRGTLSPGGHELHWDRRDESGRSAHAGIYFMRVLSSGFNATRKIILVE